MILRMYFLETLGIMIMVRVISFIKVVVIFTDIYFLIREINAGI